MKDREIFEKETGYSYTAQGYFNKKNLSITGIEYWKAYALWWEKRNEWVSVKDRLPEERGYYLCYGYDRNNKREFKVLFLISTKDGFGDDEYCMKPTHWRPLPTPPDEAKRGRG